MVSAKRQLMLQPSLVQYNYRLPVLYQLFNDLQLEQVVYLILLRVIASNYSSSTNPFQLVKVKAILLGPNNLALRHCKLAQAKYAQLTGKNSEGVAMTCNLIGHIQAEASDYLLAQHYYEKAYKIYREQIGQNYQNLLQVVFNLAALYLNIDEDNKALQVYEHTQHLVQNDPSYASNTTIMELYRCLGVNCLKLYLYERSIQDYQKAFEFALGNSDKES